MTGRRCSPARGARPPCCELAHRITGGLHETPGVLWIEPSAAADLDPHATVLAVESDGEPALYRGSGRF